MEHADEFQDFRPFFLVTRPVVLNDRPERLDPICTDDLINLQIALALSKDVLDFVEDHHIFRA